MCRLPIGLASDHAIGPITITPTPIVELSAPNTEISSVRLLPLVQAPGPCVKFFPALESEAPRSGGGPDTGQHVWSLGDDGHFRRWAILGEAVGDRPLDALGRLDVAAPQRLGGQTVTDYFHLAAL